MSPASSPSNSPPSNSAPLASSSAPKRPLTQSIATQPALLPAMTRVDLEAAGSFTDILVAPQGLLYAFAAGDGRLRPGFPVRFAGIAMRPLCADIAGDAYLEIVVGDLAGVLAVLDYRGEEVWSRSLSGPLSLGLAIADVDGDGTLDVVAVTDNGDVWVLNGETGNEIPRFPIRTGSRMKSNPLIVDLSKEGDRVHIVLATGDGELLIVDGKTYVSQSKCIVEGVCDVLISARRCMRRWWRCGTLILI